MARQSHAGHRHEKIMADPRMDPANPDNPPMPFDGKRMILGGFSPILDIR